jgi:hypothetical protein
VTGDQSSERLEDLIVRALAAEFGGDESPNPDHPVVGRGRRWGDVNDDELDIPATVPAGIDAMRDRPCMVSFTAMDGGPAIRALTYAEVARVAAETITQHPY